MENLTDKTAVHPKAAEDAFDIKESADIALDTLAMLCEMLQRIPTDENLSGESCGRLGLTISGLVADIREAMA